MLLADTVSANYLLLADTLSANYLLSANTVDTVSANHLSLADTIALIVDTYYVSANYFLLQDIHLMNRRSFHTSTNGQTCQQ